MGWLICHVYLVVRFSRDAKDVLGGWYFYITFFSFVKLKTFF